MWTFIPARTSYATTACSRAQLAAPALLVLLLQVALTAASTMALTMAALDLSWVAAPAPPHLAHHHLSTSSKLSRRLVEGGTGAEATEVEDEGAGSAAISWRQSSGKPWRRSTAQMAAELCSALTLVFQRAACRRRPDPFTLASLPPHDLLVSN